LIAQKIKLYPTKAQRQTLKEWFGVQRWVYNKCLKHHIENQEKGIKTTIKGLRENIINNVNFQTENTWMLQYSYDLRDEAVRDFMKNISSNIAKGGKFKLNFRSLKQQKLNGCSLSVLKKHWNRGGFYSSIFNRERLRGHQKLPKELLKDSRLIKTATKKYFISLPKIEEKSDSQADENSMIFLDPGVKNFVTGYDPSGKSITWGARDVGRIARLLHYKSKLQGRIKKQTKNKRRASMRIAMLRIGEKLRNLVKDLHQKLSKFLCMNYKYIYLPRLNFHDFKQLNKKSKAKLASLQHCGFLDNLITKARVYGSRVFEVNEAYTSKTCCNCGYLKQDLSNKDVYNCSNCKIKIGRDINASKNIMLRYFTRATTLISSGIEA
jgi:IS605 OrfB family transposase